MVLDTVRYAVSKIGGGFSCSSAKESLESLRERHGGFLFGMAVQTAALAASGGIGASAGVSACCVPLIVPIETPLSGLDPRIFALLSETPKKCAGRISMISGIQVSLALAEIFLGDPVRGVSDLLQGGFGFYIVTTEGLPSLPLYTFTTGFTGMLGISRLQEIWLVTGRASILGNYLTLASAAQPVLCLLGCYYGWSLVVSLRESLVPLTQGGMPLGRETIIDRELNLPQSFSGRGRRVASLEEVQN